MRFRIYPLGYNDYLAFEQALMKKTKYAKSYGYTTTTIRIPEYIKGANPKFELNELLEEGYFEIHPNHCP